MVLVNKMALTLKCNNCNIVIDELLSYVQNKISLIDEESLIRICVGHFGIEEIQKSKSLLFESLTAGSRKIVRKGQGKENRALCDIISAFKAADPDLMPVFVARNLEKLPPITFDHLDVSDLLKRLTVLQSEIKDVKMMYATMEQMNELKVDVMNLKNRVDESSISTMKLSNVNMKRGAATIQSSGLDDSDYTLCEDSTRVESLNIGLTSSPKINNIVDEEDVNKNMKIDEGVCISLRRPLPADAQMAAASEITSEKGMDVRVSSPEPNAPSEQMIGRGKQIASTVSNKTTDSDGQWILVANRKSSSKYRMKGKIGTAELESGNFKAADRNIPIFISNVHIDTNEKDIVDYICCKTRLEVKLEQIRIKNHTSYKAYKFFIPQSKEHMLLNDNLWPKGIVFRRFVHFTNKVTPGRVRSGNGPYHKK